MVANMTTSIVILVMFKSVYDISKKYRYTPMNRGIMAHNSEKRACWLIIPPILGGGWKIATRNQDGSGKKGFLFGYSTKSIKIKLFV